MRDYTPITGAYDALDEAVATLKKTTPCTVCCTNNNPFGSAIGKFQKMLVFSLTFPFGTVNPEE